VTIEVVRHARAKGYRLRLDPRTGKAKLTIPARARLKDAMAWANSQQGWLDAQRARLPQGRPFVPGAEIPFGDRLLTLEWRAAAPRTPAIEGVRLVCGGPADGFAGRIERWLRREALRTLSEETAEFALRAGVSVTGVGIGDPRGRWGSCSSRGDIRYSWRLILAPDFVRRATVAHEVAHRVHMDHSPRFHRLVDQLLEGDAHPARAWLRAHGSGLHWYGREAEA
jgi:predicted metal-dependent hydrolase